MEGTGENLAAILSAWSALLREGDTRALAELLDPGVVWQGVVPESGCSGPKRVLHYLRLGPPAPRLTRIEAQEFGDRVAVSVESPDFQANEWLEAGAPRSLIFTLRGGKVVRLESFMTRDAAFAAVAS